MLKIKAIDLANRRQVRDFIHFPFQLYKDCPQWVPPLIQDAYTDFNPRKHPYYKHSELQPFLAEKDGKTAGRLAALDNRLYNQHLGKKTAFFGFYDVIEDLEVSQALFQAAFDWSRERGMDSMIGPRALNSTDNVGILVEGFEHRAAMWQPYNHPYFDRFIREAGFIKVTDHLSGYARADEIMPERLVRISEKIRKKAEEIQAKTPKENFMCYRESGNEIRVVVGRDGHREAQIFGSPEKDIYLAAVERCRPVKGVSEDLGIPLADVVSILENLEKKGLILFASDRQSFMALAIEGDAPSS